MKKFEHTSPNKQPYFNFFLQLPPTDYLDDLTNQDELEQPRDLAVHGLSDEQVSQIALDSLQDARQSRRQQAGEPRQTRPKSSN